MTVTFEVELRPWKTNWRQLLRKFEREAGRIAERAIIGPVNQQWREMMTAVRNPDHVTFAVANAAAAIKFFELLGFRKQHVLTIDGGPPARYMGMPDMKAQHITLALEGSQPRFEIQLLEFDPTPPEDPGEHPSNLRRRGYNHLGLRVDNIAAVTSHLVDNGVKMLSDEMDYISRRLRLFEGPEGITLELVEGVDSASGEG